MLSSNQTHTVIHVALPKHSGHRIDSYGMCYIGFLWNILLKYMLCQVIHKTFGYLLFFFAFISLVIA